MNRELCDGLIEKAFAGLPVRVCTNKDEKYRHLPEGFRLWVTGGEGHNEVTVDILFEGTEEYTVCFGGWHGHFGLDDVSMLVYIMKRIFSNKAYTEDIVLEGRLSAPSLIFEPDDEEQDMMFEYAPCDEASAREYAGEENIKKGARVVCRYFGKEKDKVFEF